MIFRYKARISDFWEGGFQMIFLYRFERTKQGMDFILNEGLAKDMMAAPAYEEMLCPLVFFDVSNVKSFSDV